jgi:hypothetical protein
MGRKVWVARLVALSAFAAGPACGSSDALITAPTSVTGPPVAVPPELPTVFGSITLTSATPPSGSAVEVYDCDPNRSADRARTSHAVGLCNQHLQLTFEVVVDQDLPDAYLFVDFLSARGHCGYASTPATLLAAHRRISLTTDFIVLSEDPNVPIPCALPATTTRVVASLRSRASGGRALLEREFDQAYTFVSR